MSKPFAIHPATLVGLSLVLGALAGWLDIHSREVQPTVLVLVLAAAALSALSPRLAWVPALLVGIGVPLAHAYARAAAIEVPYPVNGGILTTFLALIPSTIGAVVGALARTMLHMHARDAG